MLTLVLCLQPLKTFWMMTARKCIPWRRLSSRSNNCGNQKAENLRKGCDHLKQSHTLNKYSRNILPVTITQILLPQARYITLFCNVPWSLILRKKPSWEVYFSQTFSQTKLSRTLKGSTTTNSLFRKKKKDNGKKGHNLKYRVILLLPYLTVRGFLKKIFVLP